MKEEFLRQMDGYDDVAKDVEVSRKYGTDYRMQKGTVAECIDRYHPSRMTLRVIDIIEETLSTKTFRLAAQDRVMPPFQAGQYIALLLEFDGVHTTRAYSMSSPPHATGYYDITVRLVPDGLVSSYLHEHVKVGDTLQSTGPAGEFYHNPVFHERSSVFLAGGCGIAPFMGMIREVEQRGLDREIHLFYGNKGTDDVIFHDQLAAIAGRCPNFHYIPVIEQEGETLPGASACRFGFITSELIQHELGDVTGKTYYMCGPSAMYDFCAAELDKLGIPKRKIRRELYGAPRSIFGSPGWPESVSEEDIFNVTVNGGEAIPARAGESLLTALERAGLRVPSLCRSGECSLCRIKLVSGNVFQPEGVLLRASDRKYGYIHSCAAYPLEDLEVAL